MFDGHSSQVYDVDFSSDGSLLASGGFDDTARLWDIKSGKCLKVFAEHEGEVTNVAFSPDSEFLATTSTHSIHLFDIRNIYQVTFKGHFDRVKYITFSPDGSLLARVY